MNNLSVKQAMEQLKQAEIINSVEVFRRWLREGKVEGAYIESKKQGWQIPEDAIIKIIATQRRKRINKEKHAFNKGFERGYAISQQIIKEKMPKFMLQGAYDERFQIHRSDFQEMTRFNKYKKKEFLTFADERIFKRGVKSPRSSISVQYLEGWFAFGHGPLIVYGPDYNYDRELKLEQQAIALLVEYLRLEFIATDKKDSSI